MATFDDFMKLDIRIGEVVKVKDFEKAHKPAYKIWVDFGDKLGIKKSSAQITDLYEKDDLLGHQVVAIINFPPRKIADFMSEILILGVYSKKGVVLLTPEHKVEKGDKIG